MSASERSVETNKMTQPVKEQRYSLGGAGNVVANLASLGVGEIYTFGVVGADPAGQKMLSIMQELKVNCEHMLISESNSWQTLAYCKPYVGDEELQRIDMGNFNELPDSLAQTLLDQLESSLSVLDLVIVNEQVLSGIHTSYLQDELAKLISDHKDNIFLFDGRNVRNKYNDAWLKINDHEALKLCGKEKDALELVEREEVLEAIDVICARLQSPLVVTRGAHGCVVCSDDGAVEVPGILVEGKIDTVGAGDSFLAGLAASLASGAKLEEAVQLGNFVSAVTIKKIGTTGTATPDEIMNVGENPSYVKE